MSKIQNVNNASHLRKFIVTVQMTCKSHEWSCKLYREFRHLQFRLASKTWLDYSQNFKIHYGILMGACSFREQTH